MIKIVTRIFAFVIFGFVCGVLWAAQDIQDRDSEMSYQIVLKNNEGEKGVSIYKLNDKAFIEEYSFSNLDSNKAITRNTVMSVEQYKKIWDMLLSTIDVWTIPTTGDQSEEKGYIQFMFKRDGKKHSAIESFPPSEAGQTLIDFFTTAANENIVRRQYGTAE